MFTNRQPPVILAMKPLRVIYVDDMRELRELVREVLQRGGHTVECYADGRQVLDRLVKNPDIDLLITDHHMPGINGLELVAQVREGIYLGKIIVFSSELRRDVAKSYRALRVDRILAKPIFPTDLRRVIAELFPAPACIG